MDTGVLYRDDNLERLAALPSKSVDLIYLDPPFFSNRFYEVIWGDEAEIRSFDDRWEGGIQHYIDWMKQRVVEMHRLLKPKGALYLHCDSHASHYLKVMLDEVFGQAMFRNEIIWRRTGANKSRKMFGPIHQTILFYAKTNATRLNPLFTPYTVDYVEEQFTLTDQRGRFRPVLLTGPGVRHGESGQPWGGYNPSAIGRHWQPSSYVYDKYRQITGSDLAEFPLLKRLDLIDEAGLMYRGIEGRGVPNYRFYLEDAPGIPLQDIWASQPGTTGSLWNQPDRDIDQDVRWIGANSAERLGYPTQKPEGLLERIISASSSQGEVVLDPFCGCGTTVAVASRLGREWVGIDISPTAIEIMKRRLLKQGVRPEIVNAIDSLDDLKVLKPFEFQNWVINAMNGAHSSRKVGDFGIDGFSFLTRDPIQVKQSADVGRPTLDAFETAMRRNGKDTGYIVAFSFTRGAVEEVARAKQEGLKINLVKVAELLLLTRRPGSRVASIGPQPDNVLDLPSPPMRKREDLPTAEELIASVRQTVSA